MELDYYHHKLNSRLTSQVVSARTRKKKRLKIPTAFSPMGGSKCPPIKKKKKKKKIKNLRERGNYKSLKVEWRNKKITSDNFQGMLRKTAVLNVSRKLPEKRLRRVHFRRLGQSNLPPTKSYTKNWLHYKSFLWSFREFSNFAGRMPIMESCFTEVTEEFLNFCILQLFRKLSSVHWCIPKSSCSRNFEKFLFNWSCKFTVYRLQP